VYGREIAVAYPGLQTVESGIVVCDDQPQVHFELLGSNASARRALPRIVHYCAHVEESKGTRRLSKARLATSALISPRESLSKGGAHEC